MIAVDGAGRIHVTFYDDRDYTDPEPGEPQEDLQPDGRYDPSGPQPKYDVFYAYSEDGGLNWTNEKLWWQTQGAGDPPAVDWNPSPQNVQIGDYAGIDVWGDQVWTSYAGTFDPASPLPDPTEDKSVIWSSIIDWSP